MAPPMQVSGSQACHFGSVAIDVEVVLYGLSRRVPPAFFRARLQTGKRHGIGTLMFDGGIFEGQWSRGEATGGGIAA